jgi:hypothetical protein
LTICIGTICDNGKACIVAADREITVPGINLEFEHADKKIEDVVDGCVVMSSVDALLAAQIIEPTRNSLGSGGGHRVVKVAEKLRDTFIAVHLERAEHVFLTPRGWTLKEFKDHGATQIPAQTYLNIDNQFFGFGLGAVDFLVAGIDPTGAHIFHVFYNGVAGGDWLEWCDRLGYGTIGSGSSHAAISLALEGQQRRLSIPETLYNVYSAKRNSESAPGVGKATDMLILTAGKSEPVKQDRLDKLNAVRDKHLKEKPGQSELEAI